MGGRIKWQIYEIVFQLPLTKDLYRTNLRDKSLKITKSVQENKIYNMNSLLSYLDWKDQNNILLHDDKFFCRQRTGEVFDAQYFVFWSFMQLIFPIDDFFIFFLKEKKGMIAIITNLYTRNKKISSLQKYK